VPAVAAHLRPGPSPADDAQDADGDTHDLRPTACPPDDAQDADGDAHDLRPCPAAVDNPHPEGDAERYTHHTR